VTVSVALDVGAPVMVAALGNRNEIVKVFDAVRRSGVDEVRVLVHGLDHAHGSVPAPERGHVPGRDHENENEHGRGHEHHRS
jgi:hypothetical protein